MIVMAEMDYLMMTLFVGRLTPAARVLVVHNTLMAPTTDRHETDMRQTWDTHETDISIKYC